MQKTAPSRQSLPVYRIPWTQAMDWLRTLVRKFREDYDQHPGYLEGVYAIPNGGTFPATILSAALDLPIVHDPTDVDVCIIVDDDVASGETMSEYTPLINHHRPDWPGHVAAAIHVRSRAKVVPAYWGAMEEAPPDHRLLWPWDYHQTRPWGSSKEADL